MKIVSQKAGFVPYTPTGLLDWDFQKNLGQLGTQIPLKSCLKYLSCSR